MQVDSVPWQLTSHMGWALQGIVEPFKYIICVTAHAQFSALELEHPWALARDNKVLLSIEYYGSTIGSTMLASIIQDISAKCVHNAYTEQLSL